MLDRPPTENERWSWLIVVAWSLLIFVSIPMARTIQAWVSEHWGRELFLYGVITIIVLLLLLSLKLLAGRRTTTTMNPVWLICVAAVFIIYTIQLRDNPEEAVHFVQYGVLGILAYRALSHRVTDNGIYAVALLLTATIGILDEALQWLTPGRIWGLKDIRLDTLAAALALCGLALGLKPALIKGPPTARTGQFICRTALVVAGLLGTSLLNTPQRIGTVVDQFPGLQFIIENSGVMAEYGYRYADQEIGIFRSRLAPLELEQTDRRRAIEAATKLDKLPALDDYSEFLRRYTPFNDPFLHEARVHLNRRDYYLKSADRYREQNSTEFQRRISVAHYENRIMEKYFPRTLLHSGFLLPEQTVNRIKAAAAPAGGYDSPVSQALITQYSERQVQWITLITVVLLLALERLLASRRKL